MGKGGGGLRTGKGTGTSVRTRLSKLPFSNLPFSFSLVQSTNAPTGSIATPKPHLGDAPLLGSHKMWNLKSQHNLRKSGYGRSRERVETEIARVERRCLCRQCTGCKGSNRTKNTTTTRTRVTYCNVVFFFVPPHLQRIDPSRKERKLGKPGQWWSGEEDRDGKSQRNGNLLQVLYSKTPRPGAETQDGQTRNFPTNIRKRVPVMKYHRMRFHLVRVG